MEQLFWDAMYEVPKHGCAKGGDQEEIAVFLSGDSLDLNTDMVPGRTTGKYVGARVVVGKENVEHFLEHRRLPGDAEEEDADEVRD